MTGFKGTKGKWVLTQLKRKAILSGDGRTGFCKIFTHTTYEGVEHEDKKGKANALLISKAPEMLEMLERTIDFFDEGRSTYSTVQDFLNEIRELIKSAAEL